MPAERNDHPRPRPVITLLVRSGIGDIGKREHTSKPPLLEGSSEGLSIPVNHGFGLRLTTPGCQGSSGARSTRCHPAPDGWQRWRCVLADSTDGCRLARWHCRRCWHRRWCSGAAPEPGQAAAGRRVEFLAAGGGSTPFWSWLSWRGRPHRRQAARARAASAASRRRRCVVSSRRRRSAPLLLLADHGGTPAPLDSPDHPGGRRSGHRPARAHPRHRHQRNTRGD
jgi:hypothetical protein